MKRSLSKGLPTLDVVLVVALFVGLALLYSFVAPVFEGFDEVWHYAFVQHVASGGGLPRQPPDQYGHLARQEGGQPPLYYLLGAALTAWVPTDDLPLYLRQNPQFRPIPTPYKDNQNYIIHGDAEAFPYTGTALAVHLTRLLSILLGVGTLLCVYGLGRRLYPSRRSVALGAMLVTALTPAFIFSSAQVNNDMLVTFLSSLALLLLLDFVARPPSYRRAVVLGVVLGCAALAKLSGLLLWPFVTVVALIVSPCLRERGYVGDGPSDHEGHERTRKARKRVAWRRPFAFFASFLSLSWSNHLPYSASPSIERKATQSRGDAGETKAQRSSSSVPLRLCVTNPFSNLRRSRASLARLVVVFAVAIVICGWWFARNWLLYGDLSALNMHLAIMGRRPDGFGLREALGEMEGLRWSYWAMFGWFNIPVPTPLYHAYDLATALGLVGLLMCVVRAIMRRRWDRLSPLTYLGAWLLLVIVGVVRWTLTTPGSQGRLLYPAIPSIAILLVVGWLALVPRGERVQRWVVTGIGIVMLVVATAIPFAIIAPTYAPPPILSPDQMDSAVTNHTDVTFENGIRLLGYTVEQANVAPGSTAWVTACWEGTGSVDEDVLVYVHMLTQDDIIAAQKDTYHGLGMFPSSHWPVGARFCDRYPLAVPDTAPAADSTTLAVGLYHANGERLTVTDGAGHAPGDEVRFPGPSISARPQDSLTYEWGHKLGLIEYELDRTTLRPGESFKLGLRWQALEAMSADYAVTIQVVDANGAKIAQDDEPLRSRSQPTSAWRVGTTMKDTRTIGISPDAPPGVYELRVGVYDFDTKRNLLPSRAGETLNPGPVPLWKLRVQ